MGHYEKMIDEIENAKTDGPRGELLGPAPLQHAEEILMKIPPRKKFLGPRSWYKVLQKLQTNSQKKQP